MTELLNYQLLGFLNPGLSFGKRYIFDKGTLTLLTAYRTT
jgi:hypothetical protein